MVRRIWWEITRSEGVPSAWFMMGRQVARLDVAPVFQRLGIQAQRRDEIGQAVHAVRIRLFVDTVDERQVMLLRQHGCGAVGHDHELLNHLLALACAMRLDVDADAILIHGELRLAALQFDAADFTGLLLEDLGQLAGQAQGTLHWRIFFLELLGGSAVKQGVHLGIDAAHLGMDDRLVEFIFLDVALLSIQTRAENVSLSSPAFREHTPLESSSGSMGMTRSAK